MLQPGSNPVNLTLLYNVTLKLVKVVHAGETVVSGRARLNRLHSCGCSQEEHSVGKGVQHNLAVMDNQMKFTIYNIVSEATARARTWPSPVHR
jgi:hypothetical protein